MVVGLNSGSWGVAGAQDIASGLSAVRWDSSSGEPLSDYTSQGLKADIAFSGPLQLERREFDRRRLLGL